MTVTKMLGYFVAILTILPKCFCVGIEYYDDKNLPDEQKQDFVQIPHTKVTVNEAYIKTFNILEHNVTDFSVTSSTVKSSNRRHHLSNSTVYPDTTFLNSTINDDSTVSKVETTMNEYEYIYDDDTKPYILRQGFPNLIQNTEKNFSLPSMKNQLTEFYNLEPAVQVLNLNVQHNYSKCYNVWYVVEDVPCWELPLLYGKFGSQKRTFDVFLMHGGKVKNVIERENEDLEFEYTPETIRVPLNYYTNKWCKTSPCYGDHTLCLFPQKSKSGICTKGYTVQGLDILEQTGLINTLNSMRNKVANGKSDRYSHLPPAANMKQIIYDYDLEHFAKVWLNQCLPGPDPCSALDETFVNQLECTKFAKYCCVNSVSAEYRSCTPKPECFIPPVIGCLNVWFWNAGDNLTYTDIQCGHTSVLSYSTAQLLWATTYKIGCAYGKKLNGDVRVICNFSPGAPFLLDTRYYCGILDLKGGTTLLNDENITDNNFLKSFGINIDPIEKYEDTDNITESQGTKLVYEETNDLMGINVLHKIYRQGRIRNEFKNFQNGTKDMIARLVVKYKFIELNGAKCDSDEPVYRKGSPGSLCLERGRRYSSLCFDYRDPTPGYRLVAVVAPIALFFLILYDLFSGIVRQTDY